MTASFLIQSLQENGNQTRPGMSSGEERTDKNINYAMVTGFSNKNSTTSHERNGTDILPSEHFSCLFGEKESSKEEFKRVEGVR